MLSKGSGLKFMCQFQIIGIVIFISSSVFGAGGDYYGIPKYNWISTGTIQNYKTPFPGDDALRSHAHGNAFADQLNSVYASKYPSISLNRKISQDSEVELSNISSIISGREMVFFAGHAWNGGGGFITYSRGTLSGTSATYGGWNRWMFIDACQVLRNTDPYFYSNYFNGGLHAIFSFHSDMWYYIRSYDCNIWGNCKHRRSEDMYATFADYYINKGYFLFNAWTEAVRIKRYEEGNYGHAPAVVYRTVFLQGKTFIGKSEIPSTTFNGDVKSGELKHSYIVYGTPTYH